MDPRFIGHNFGYPVNHSQYYSHPSFWASPHLSDESSSLNLKSSRKSAFAVPVKREQSDGEESNKSSDSEHSDEDDQCDSKQTLSSPQTEALNCVLPGIERSNYHTGLIIPPAPASASSNSSLDGSDARKSPDNENHQTFFPPIYAPLPLYQPTNFNTHFPISNFPRNIQKHVSECSIPIHIKETTHRIFSPTQPSVEEPVSPIPSALTSPDSQLSPASSISTPSPVSASTVTDPDFKKPRTCYTVQQVQSLERMFLENQYPDGDIIENMSRDLDIAQKNLKIWFQNKRARTRRRVQRYGPEAGTPPAHMAPVPADRIPVPVHMTPVPSDWISAPTHMAQVPAHMSYGLPMPSPHNFPGSFYHPYTLPFLLGSAFALQPSALSFPHSVMPNFQNTHIIKKENITTSPPSQFHHQPNSQSPIPFYRDLSPPTVT